MTDASDMVSYEDYYRRLNACNSLKDYRTLYQNEYRRRVDAESMRNELLEIIKAMRDFAGAGLPMAAKNDHNEAVTLAIKIINMADDALARINGGAA